MPATSRDDEKELGYILPVPAAGLGLAQALAGHLAAGDLIALDGPLGAGKTTFVRALVTALDGDADRVASPTYTLLHVYPCRLPLIHVDAYRLTGGADLEALGFGELIEDGVGCVEWADHIADLVDHGRRCWRLRFDHHERGRSVSLRPADPHFTWEGVA